MIKVNYDSTTGEIKGFYPNFIDYETIPEPNIEIDETTHQDCINNQGLRRVDLKTLKIVEYTPPGPTLSELQDAAWGPASNPSVIGASRQEHHISAKSSTATKSP